MWFVGYYISKLHMWCVGYYISKLHMWFDCYHISKLHMWFDWYHISKLLNTNRFKGLLNIANQDEQNGRKCIRFST